VCAARHLAIDDGGIARNVLAKVPADELCGDREAASLRPDHDRDGLAFVEVSLRIRRRERHHHDAGDQADDSACLR
jgi:hypothetical protein